MGIFDNFYSKQIATVEFLPKTEQEAWFAIMYACAGADSEASDVEIDNMMKYLVFKTFFDNYKPDLVDDLVDPIIAHYHDFGSKVLIENSVSLVHEENKATLFSIVFDILLADGILSKEDKEISEFLIDKMDLDEELARKIIEVLLIKNKYSIKIR